MGKKKVLLLCLVGILVVAAAGIAAGYLSEACKVEFSVLDDSDIPKDIETEIILQYRELERALGCLIDGKVYVVVTRGEKPTAGYSLEMGEMALERKDGESKLKVKAVFKDPLPDQVVAQVISYPYQVAETSLLELPDSIELVTVFE